MNQELPYELTIREKLEQLSAPDMVDAIWLRIEAQLDLDMPTDDGPTEPPPTPGSGPLTWISSIVLLVIFTTFITRFINQQNSSPATEQQIIPENSILQHNNEPPPGPIPLDNNNRRIPDTDERADFPAQLTEPDSTELAIAILKEPALQDDDSVAASPALKQPIPKPDSTSKKSRGVKNLSDEDYRIVPKNDSSG